MRNQGRTLLRMGIVNGLYRRLPSGVQHRIEGRPSSDFGLTDAEADRRLDDARTFASLLRDHDGRIVHKWLHYLPTYEALLGSRRGTPVRFLEIGVSEGGSLEIWRRWFGDEAVITGIDVNPACAERVDPPNRVRIGSQADESFLREVAREMGGVDVVLDDGSHVASHQRTSFRVLFPLLPSDGLYLIEDTHTAYWGGQFGGGYRRPESAIEFAKNLIDDLHAWHHGRDVNEVPAEQLQSVSFHDSIIAIQKAARPRPGHARWPQGD